VNAGFWFTRDDYLGPLPAAAGAMDTGGAQTALRCKTVLLRPYYKGNPAPSWLAQKIMELDAQAQAQAQHAPTIYYQVGNEPNLPFEDWQGGIPAYTLFFKAVRSLLPPTIKLAWAGMSPGIDGYLDWYAAAVPANPDAVVAHVYAQHYPDMINLTTTIVNVVDPLPVVVGEANFGPGPTIEIDRDAWATDVWRKFLAWTENIPRIIASLYFAYTWNADTPLKTPVDAKGTKIVPVTLGLNGWPTPAPPPTAAPQGRAWWIWYIDQCGGVPGIIDACRRTRTTNVFVKGGDGPYAWDQVTTQLVDELTNAGLNVYLWHYAYLGWLPNTVHGDDFKWSVHDEAGCVKNMLARGGPNVKGFIADVEAESEGRWRQATAYCNVLRPLLAADNRWFAYAPLPVIDYHQALPYVQFNAYCDAVLPQFYSRNLQGDPPWTLDRLLEQWTRWTATWRAAGQAAPVLMPVGEAYGLATVQSVRDFETLVKWQEWPSWSYWSLQHALASSLITALETDEEPMSIQLEPEDRSEVEAIFDQMWAGAAHLHALLTKPVYGAGGARTGYWAEQMLKGGQALIKEILGLND
jgi:hypothetical protein